MSGHQISHSGSNVQGPFIWSCSEQRINIEIRGPTVIAFNCAGRRLEGGGGPEIYGLAICHGSPIVGSPPARLITVLPGLLRSVRHQSTATLDLLQTPRRPFPPPLSRCVLCSTRPILPPLASRSPAQPAPAHRSYELVRPVSHPFAHPVAKPLLVSVAAPTFPWRV